MYTTMPNPSYNAIEPHVNETTQFFKKAYNNFNKQLHNGELPGCHFAFQPLVKSLSKFKPSGTRDIEDHQHDTIIINSAMMLSADDIKVLAALDDAMISQSQHHFGKPGRNEYRNKERASLAKNIGLHPSSTSAEGGKEIGHYIGFYIIEDSPFHEAAKDFLSYGYKVGWEEVKNPSSNPDTKSGKTFKYICPHPECGQSFRGNSQAQFKCVFHDLIAIQDRK